VAKSPGTPKSKAAAPVQFDMNSRERKGGKGRPGGPGGAGRGRDDKRPPSRIVRLPPALIDRGEGWVIQKIGRIDEASHIAMGAEYHLIFDGHDPLTFDYLANARDRAKEAPPEKPQVEKVAIAPETGERNKTAGPRVRATPPVVLKPASACGFPLVQRHRRKRCLWPSCGA
jgi:hypothetical protein